MSFNICRERERILIGVLLRCRIEIGSWLVAKKSKRKQWSNKIPSIYKIRIWEREKNY